MQDKYRIDNHKLIFHPRRVAQWQEGHYDWESAKKIYPIYMEVSPVGYCNHHCVFCAVDYIGYKNREIPYEILKSTLTEMAQFGVKSVMFAGEGEPTLYKNLSEILEYCTKIGIDTALTTNMVPFNEKNTEVIIKNCKWIKVSINAGNSETYAKIHGTNENNFNMVINNMKRAVSLRKEKGYSCTLGAQILLLPDNKDTLIELAQITKEAGFDYLVVKPYSQHLSSITDKYKDISYSEYLYIDEQLKSYNSDNFKVIFRKQTMNKLSDPDDRYAKCRSVPFFWGYIMADGSVYGCSAYLENDKFCYGNINENNFQDIWESNKRKDCYEFVKDKMNAVDCRVNCRMDDINRYLSELDNPCEHVNFI